MLSQKSSALTSKIFNKMETIRKIETPCGDAAALGSVVCVITMTPPVGLLVDMSVMLQGAAVTDKKIQLYKAV